MGIPVVPRRPFQVRFAAIHFSLLILAARELQSEPAGGRRIQEPTVRADTDSVTRKVPDASRDTSLAGRPAARTPQSALRGSQSAAPADSFPIGLALNARLEARGERNRNERCAAQQVTLYAATCRSPLQPTLDMQFNVKSGGTLAERVRVDVDYDSQREFDASNAIGIRYSGKLGEPLRSVDIGSVSFAPPASRFITGGIPTSNYGVQAAGVLGQLQLNTIVARQTGNVVRDRIFTIGERTLQGGERELEDHQIEPRRFFFTVDPRQFDRYPNIDILDAARMRRLATALADSIRPVRVVLYRVVLGGQPPNPNGPRFQLIGDPDSRRGLVYEPLRENVDYYVDPSQLWLALVRPLSLGTERLVVAYSVRVNGRDTTIASTGGTPDREFIPGREQWASLLWDPQVQPGDAAFSREIRSVYRIGGDEVRRETIQARIVTGAATDQEKPLAGGDATYLKMFRLARVNDDARLDAAGRVWPRDGDPVLAFGTDPASGARVIRDRFLVFPSVQPFSSAGLVTPGNPVSDTLYRTPSDYLYSPQHPPSAYRIRLSYQTEAAAGSAGTLALGAIQLRPGSERLVLDGVPLLRGADYTVDYELGRVVFQRPDTLFRTQRQVSVRFEENPQFVTTPTSIFGITSLLPLPNGSVGFTAITQGQTSTLTRPPLGLEPATSLVAGLHGEFAWGISPLSRALRWIPSANANAPSNLSLHGELAASRPNPGGSQQAFLESFEGEGGITIPLSEPSWYYSSQPALGTTVASRFGGDPFALARAATLAWQNTSLGANRKVVSYTIEQIDPQVRVLGVLAPAEQVLWLTMYPLRVGGLFRDGSGFHWKIAGTPAGRRWRSIRVSLGASGADLSRVEQMELWTAVDTSAARRGRNPSLVIDIGELSENSIAISPDTIIPAGADTAYAGRRIVGLDTLDSERDPISRAFNAARDDNGLPGDVAPRLTMRGSNAVLTKVRLCSRSGRDVPLLGDATANCTVRNDRLDEEDLDGDNVLNFTSNQRERERLARFTIDLADPRNFVRVGRCNVGFGGAPDATLGADATVGARADSSTRCWVLVRVPFRSPDELLNSPNLRRARAVRLTMVSGTALEDDAFFVAPVTRFRLLGAPWLRRTDRPAQGIAGDPAAGGYVIVSTIGRNRDQKEVKYAIHCRASTTSHRLA